MPLRLTVSSGSLDKILFSPQFQPLLAVLKGARNGIVYGTKVRFPHSLIMALLFSSAPWPKRLSNIAKGTRTHAFNLAKFVSIYKTAMFLQSSLTDTRGGHPKTGKLDPFWAGLLGGYIVFGERSPISEQIVLYVLSRVVTALLPREPLPEGAPQGAHQPIEKRTFTVLAALVWGVVMYQFQHHRERLAGGMVSSMKYLYVDSDSWSSWKTLLWHNK